LEEHLELLPELSELLLVLVLLEDEDEDELEIDELDDDDTELLSSSDESTRPVTALMSRMTFDNLTQSDLSRTYAKAVEAQRKPTQTDAVRPLRSRKRPYTDAAARGMVTNQDDRKKMVVASLYRPCAPISAQNTVPAVMIMLPTPMSGIFSAIIR
jgi:hypothetical protein